MYNMSNMRKCFFTLMTALLSAPVAVFADNHSACAGEGLCYSLESPLNRDIGSIEALLTAILNVLLIIAVPIIVFFIIFAGFSYVTAQGNPEKVKQATRSLTYAIIGGVLILGGVAISEIIASVVASFSN